jgi:FkbM family methyltransferase
MTPFRSALNSARWTILRKLGGHHPAMLIRDLLAEREVRTVLDVGANRGQYGRFLRDKAGFRGRIVSFEPVPAVADILRGAAAGDPSWDVVEAALSGCERQVDFQVARDTLFSSVLPVAESGREIYGDRAEAVERISLRTRRLDTILPELGVDPRSERVFLKCDTQGNDLAVIDGAGGLLEHFVGVQAEVAFRQAYAGAANGLADVTAVLSRAGFELAGLSPVVTRSFVIYEADACFVNGRYA